MVSQVRFAQQTEESPTNPEKKVSLSPEQRAFVKEKKSEHVQQLHEASLLAQSATPASSPGGEDGKPGRLVAKVVSVTMKDDKDGGGKS